MCENVSCERGGQRLFAGFGVTVFPGNVLVLRGKNGSGKTSLLRALAGLLPLAEGQVMWNEVSIHDVYDEYSDVFAYIGHKLAVNDVLTVGENLRFWARLYDSELMFPAAVGCFGLDEYLDFPCWKLSKGWKQKLGLTRVLLTTRQLWLLDEPAVHLDQEGRDLLYNMITVRAREGGMVVLASHESVPIQGAIEVALEDYSV